MKFRSTTSSFERWDIERFEAVRFREVHEGKDSVTWIWTLSDDISGTIVSAKIENPTSFSTLHTIFTTLVEHSIYLLPYLWTSHTRRFSKAFAETPRSSCPSWRGNVVAILLSLLQKTRCLPSPSSAFRRIADWTRFLVCSKSTTFRIGQRSYLSFYLAFIVVTQNSIRWTVYWLCFSLSLLLCACRSSERERGEVAVELRKKRFFFSSYTHTHTTKKGRFS